MIKPVLGNTTLLLVGGMRTVNYMEGVLKNHYANFISMSRPFIRDPFLVIKIEKGTIDKISSVDGRKSFIASLIPFYQFGSIKILVRWPIFIF